ncbi:YggS family pyridoxal phosphate-dependent enzyme, partial [Candidatus Pelagibacter sp.]|nr:YggS family pyridoxal phosphate-dependent enzyme [Candidatus Pelagibacter sp.]
MHNTVQKLIDIENKIKLNLEDININNLPKIIAVSKTFKLDKILPLIHHGHIDFGENKIQEAIDKWTDIKEKNTKIQLHMIGKLQTNKVKFAVKLFDYIHSVDSEKLAKKIVEEQVKINKKIKIFIQVNIGKENQKSGIEKDRVNDLVVYCKKINLNVVGLMCIPP